MKTKRQRSLERVVPPSVASIPDRVSKIKFPEAETPAVPSKPKKNAMLRNDW